MEVEPIRKIEDVKRMYKYLNEHHTQREAECFLIGCNVALRAGDLLSLKFLQMSDTHVTINEQKTGKKKRFPITKVVRDAVVRLKEYYDSKGFKATYLFQSTSNRAAHLCQPICIQWLGCALKKGSRELGFKDNINTHSMRKTWGYHAYENGADILYIQGLFNHTSQHITLRYIGVTKSTIEQLYIDNTLEIA